ncbi:MAG: glycerophosphodiester phosphodiesterase family protein [Ruminococcaceae bacterium]|nr:glycerophosphodiester phosphodiesterase family protein [Oscillospiraceae bacterium]
MHFDLRETARDHMFIVAHRGVSGGNIPCNTLTAYEIALKQGADMIEVDLSTTADGKLVIFHPGMERYHLNEHVNIAEMPYEEVKKLRYCNYDRCPTQFGIVPFDDILETFKGRCYINIDKFWGNPVGIYNAVKQHNMQEQILVKSALSDQVLDVLTEVAPELPFIPIVSESHPQHQELMKKMINYVGAEVLFAKDDSVLASEEFIDGMHRDGKLVWVNSIIYNHKAQLSGEHSDDTAFTESFEYGWGWLANRGFDIIQTDWPLMLINFLKETGRYYH